MRSWGLGDAGSIFENVGGISRGDEVNLFPMC